MGHSPGDRMKMLPGELRREGMKRDSKYDLQ